MGNMMRALEAKSDQMNFVDLGDNGETIITIEGVDFDFNRAQQKIWIYYTGCNNKPYKPSVGMSRVLVGAWGEDQDGRDWVGKSIKLYGDGSVTFGKGEVGGIRIRALSDIPKDGYTAYIQKNKRVRVKQTIPLLVVEKAKPKEPTEMDLQWVAAAKGDPETLNQITDKSYRAYIESLIANS